MRLVLQPGTDDPGTRSLALVVLSLLLVASCAPIRLETQRPSSARASECVILLHGLGRSRASMDKMARALHGIGYAVSNVGYPSRSAPIESLATPTIERGLANCRSNGASKVHFVTHSLGGILVRYYLKDHEVPQLGRVVMLAPPNQGSEAADIYRRFIGFRLLNGDAGFQLGTDSASVPLSLGRAEFDVGVIAGDRTIDPITSLMLPNPDDGKVSVASTRLEGMRDFIVVHRSHAFIMRANEAIRQTAHFLETGRFTSEGNR